METRHLQRRDDERTESGKIRRSSLKVGKEEGHSRQTNSKDLQVWKEFTASAKSPLHTFMWTLASLRVGLQALHCYCHMYLLLTKSQSVKLSFDDVNPLLKDFSFS